MQELTDFYSSLGISSAVYEYGEKVLIAKVDVDAEPDLARRFGIMSIPTVVFLKNGREFERKVGLMGPEVFSKILDENL